MDGGNLAPPHIPYTHGLQNMRDPKSGEISSSIASIGKLHVAKVYVDSTTRNNGRPQKGRGRFHTAEECTLSTYSTEGDQLRKPQALNAKTLIPKPYTAQSHDSKP